MTNITIPNSVISIGEYAFSICNSLTSINIPDSVTSIGGSAFSNCSSLTSIDIPDSVTSIGDYVFYDCDSLTNITIPNSVISIGEYAFSFCNSLTSINIPDSVTSIGNNAFYYCSSLTSITIPDNVASIGDNVFCYCYSLETVYYCGTEEQWNSISIGSYNEKLTSATRYYHSISGWETTEPTCTTDGKRENVCSICGEGVVEIIPATGHSYTSDTLVSPTCTEDGYTTYKCTACGDTYTEINSALGHAYEETVILPTCEESGYTEYTCTVCGDSYTDSWVSPLEHILHFQYTQNYPTADENGTDIYYCERCYEYIEVLTPTLNQQNFDYCLEGADSIFEEGAYIRIISFKGTDSVVEIPEYIEWCPVFYIDDYAFSNSTITEISIPETVKGIGNYAFSGCSYLDTVYYCGDWSSISIGYGNSYLNSAFRYHHKIDWVIGSEATCTENGFLHGYCDLCNEYNSQTIPATGHSYTSLSTEKTCTEYGYTVYTCSACGDTYTVTDTESGYAEHSYPDKWTVKTVATCTADGEEYKVCTACGHTISQVIPALGHSYTSASTEKTCTEYGYTVYTCYACGDTYTVTDTESGYAEHTYNPDEWIVATAPTCTADGEEYKKCTECGYIVTQALESLGHNFATEYTVDKAATDFEEGSKSKHCLRCDAVTDINVIAKTSIANGTCGDNAKWALRSDGKLIISGSGATKNYGSQGAVPWYTYYSSIKTVEIGENITHIGHYNFRCLTNLTKVICDNPDITFSAYYPLPNKYVYFYGFGGGSLEEFTDANSYYVLIKPDNPETPVAPRLYTKNSTSIILVALKGYEYSKDGSSWQKSNIFSDLLPDTEYVFYQRIAEGVYKASSKSEVLRVQTNILPLAPQIENVSKNIVTVASISGYEYSIDGVNFQRSNIFTNLEYDVIYSIYQRECATITTLEPTVSEAVKILIPSAPEIKLIGATKMLVKAVEGYEYSIDSVVWQTDNLFEDLIPEFEYVLYQRYADQSVYSVSSVGLEFVTYGQDEVCKTPNATHLTSLRKALLFVSKDMSCDYNGDGEINIIDLVRLKKILVSVDNPVDKEADETQTIELLSEIAYLDNKSIVV